MAGVGFELKKLFSARTVVGHLKAYSYTAAITAGPFALLACMVFSVQALYILNGTVDESADLFTAAIVYAFIITSVSSYKGYTVVGGSVEVGKASTDAVVLSSILVLFSDIFLTQILT